MKKFKGYVIKGKLVFRVYFSFVNDAGELTNRVVNFNTLLPISTWDKKNQWTGDGNNKNYKIFMYRKILEQILEERHLLNHSEMQELYRKKVRLWNVEHEDEESSSKLKDPLLSAMYIEYVSFIKDRSENYKRKFNEFRRNWIERHFPKIRLSDINIDFINEYSKVMDPLSHNTKRDHIKILKRVLNHARKNGYAQVMKFNEDSIKLPEIKRKQVVWLTMDEVLKLGEVEVTGSEEKKVLACFLFRIYTGIRHMEMDQVDASQIDNDGFQNIWDTKKEGHKYIEIPKPARQLLNDWGGKLPTISQQKENKLIKELAKRANLTRDVHTSIKYRGEGRYKLWETLTTHDARRTFASLMYRHFNLTLEEVRELMAHDDTSTTLLYIGASDRKPALRNLFD